MRIVLCVLGLIPLACMVLEEIIKAEASHKAFSNQDAMEHKFKSQRNEIYKRYSHVMSPEMKQYYK